MVQRFCYLLIAIGLGLLFRATVSAQESFYKGKMIRIIVGAPPGGGYDTYSRLVARHIGKHIPGNPTVIVENMPGAATLIRPTRGGAVDQRCSGERGALGGSLSFSSQTRLWRREPEIIGY